MRNFQRTADSIREYDRIGAKMNNLHPDADPVEVMDLLADWDSALLAVGMAFADDTADINDRDLVLLGFQPHCHQLADIRSARTMALG